MVDATADCLICRKHEKSVLMPGGPVYEDELVVASHRAPLEDTGRIYRGWCFLETRRHAPSFSALNGEEAAAVGTGAARLSRALERVLAVERVYVFVLGDRIPHFHLHLVPRHPGAPREYRGMRAHEWTDAPTVDEGEAAALAAQLREQMKRT